MTNMAWLDYDSDYSNELDSAGFYTQLELFIQTVDEENIAEYDQILTRYILDSNLNDTSQMTSHLIVAFCQLAERPEALSEVPHALSALASVMSKHWTRNVTPAQRLQLVRAMLKLRYEDAQLLNIVIKNSSEEQLFWESLHLADIHDFAMLIAETARTSHHNFADYLCYKTLELLKSKTQCVAELSETCYALTLMNPSLQMTANLIQLVHEAIRACNEPEQQRRAYETLYKAYLSHTYDGCGITLIKWTNLKASILDTVAALDSSLNRHTSIAPDNVANPILQVIQERLKIHSQHNATAYLNYQQEFAFELQSALLYGHQKIAIEMVGPAEITSLNNLTGTALKRQHHLQALGWKYLALDDRKAAALVAGGDNNPLFQALLSYMGLGSQTTAVAPVNNRPRVLSLLDEPAMNIFYQQLELVTNLNRFSKLTEPEITSTFQILAALWPMGDSNFEMNIHALVYCLKKSRYYDLDLFEKIAQWIESSGAHSRIEDTTKVASVLAYFNHTHNDRLNQLILDNIDISYKTWARYCPLDILTNTHYALAIINPSHDIFRSRFDEICTARLAAAYDDIRSDKTLISRAINRQDRHDKRNIYHVACHNYLKTYLYYTLNNRQNSKSFTKKKFKALQQEFTDKLTRSQYEASCTVTALHSWVKSSLERVCSKQFSYHGAKPEVLVEHSVLPYSIDLAFKLGDIKVAIEVNGPYHYNTQGGRLGYDLQKQTSLEYLGWLYLSFTNTEIARYDNNYAGLDSLVASRLQSFSNPGINQMLNKRLSTLKNLSQNGLYFSDKSYQANRAGLSKLSSDSAVSARGKYNRT